MTWVRIDDGFSDHPKIVAAGPLGAIIQVRALCYCARHLTDGFIPDGAVSGLVAGMDHISISSGGVPGLFDVADEASDLPWCDVMCACALWEKVAGGYRVHDYLDYNPSKSEVVQLRRKKAKAGRAGGQAFARARAVAHDEHAVTEEEGPRTRTRTPTPTPESTSTSDSKTHTAGLSASFARLWNLNPHKVDKDRAEKAYRKLSPDEVLQALLEGALAAQRTWSDRPGRFFPHLATWLNNRRWEDEPPRPALLTDRTAGNLDVARRFVERMGGKT